MEGPPGRSLPKLSLRLRWGPRLLPVEASAMVRTAGKPPGRTKARAPRSISRRPRGALAQPLERFLRCCCAASEPSNHRPSAHATPAAMQANSQGSVGPVSTDATRVARTGGGAGLSGAGGRVSPDPAAAVAATVKLQD